MHRTVSLLRASSATMMRPLMATAAKTVLSRAMLQSAAAAVPRRCFADSASSSASGSGSSSDRYIPKPVFSSYKIYKSKTALDVSVIRAQLGWNSQKVEERRYLSLKKSGGFRLTFASGENKNYNWEEGQVITLNVTELGDVLAFAANKDAPEHKIFHDPLLGSDLAGQTRKELVLKRMGAGKPGYFFNFAVNSKESSSASGESSSAGSKRWSIAVSEGEFQVLLALIKQTLPDLLAVTTKPQIMMEESYAAQKAARMGGNNGEDSNASASSQQAPRKKWNDAK